MQRPADTAADVISRDIKLLAENIKAGEFDNDIEDQKIFPLDIWPK
jgi:hypothetical protein